jgi:hypothetical protein
VAVAAPAAVAADHRNRSLFRVQGGLWQQRPPSPFDRPNKSHNFDLLAPFLPSFSGSFETEELGRSLTISVDLEGTGTTARQKGKRLASGERSRVKKDVRE